MWRNLKISLVMLLSATAAMANFALPMRMDQMSEQASYLFYVSREIPWLLQEGAEYDINFFKIMDHQNSIVQLLSQDSEYLRHIESRKALLQYEVDVLDSRQGKVQTLPKDLLADLQKLNQQKNETNEERLQDIASLLGEYRKYNARGILTGLINCLPSAERKAFFQMSPDQAAQALENSNALTDEAIQKSFHRNTVSLPPDQILGKKILLEKYHLARQNEKRLFLEILNYKMQAESDLESLLESPLWIDETNWRDIDTKDMAKFMGASLKEYRIDGDKTKNHVIGHFLISEKPPYLAEFRGIVGGDCSSSYSTFMVYAEQERTFYIYDEHKHLKGYAQATLVQAKHEGRVAPALYLHDVVGSRLSPRLMEQVIVALGQRLKDFGAEMLLLPTVQVIQNNNNYSALVAAQTQMIEGAPLAEITYLPDDQRIREALQASGTMSNPAYDMPASNTHGHVVAVAPKDYRLSISMTELHKDLTLPELTAKQAVLLYLGMTFGSRTQEAADALQAAWEIATGGRASNFAQRDAAAKVLATQFSLNSTYLQQLSQALINPKQLPTAQYEESLRAAFAKLKIELEPSDSENFDFLFRQGYLRAQDAMTSGDSRITRRTVSGVLWFLKRWPKSVTVAMLLKQNPEFFSSSVAFKNYVAGLISNDTAKMAQLQWLVETDPMIHGLLVDDIGKLEALKSSNDPQISQAADQIWPSVKQALVSRNKGEMTCQRYVN